MPYISAFGACGGALWIRMLGTGIGLSHITWDTRIPLQSPESVDCICRHGRIRPSIAMHICYEFTFLHWIHMDAVSRDVLYMMYHESHEVQGAWQDEGSALAYRTKCDP